jgi:hypothetical protein
VETLRLSGSYIRDWNSFRNLCGNLLDDTTGDTNAVGVGYDGVVISVMMMPFTSY